MKTEVEITVEGDSLATIVEQAQKELRSLHSTDWTIDNVRVWGRQDAAARNDGLVTIFSATVEASAEVTL